MINIIYDRPAHCVTIDGHALSGDPGKDLVCAAVSTLAFTLAQNLMMIDEDPAIRLDQGFAKLKASHHGEYDKCVGMIFDTICIGFEMLAENYPGNVEYDVVLG